MTDLTNPLPAPGPDATGIVSANLSATTDKDDPLVNAWFKKIKAAEKHWSNFHKRVRHNRDVVRGIDESAQPHSVKYNKYRANLIQSDMMLILSKVYAKNPQMSAAPVNKGSDLKLLCETVSTVTQSMLEDAGLKRQAKRSVRAAMTCSFGIVKALWQQDIRVDPIIVQRIQDTQDNIIRIEALLASVDPQDGAQQCADLEVQKRELEQAIAGLEAQKETVAAVGIVLDRVRTDRLLVDTAIDDIWDYCDAEWMVEKIPMRKSKAMGLFKDFKFDGATTFKVGDADKSPEADGSYTMNMGADAVDDPLILVYEAWSKVDNTIYTMVDGIKGQFARPPYQPTYAGERWWPYFLLPFQSVDGVFAAQSLVDVMERLQEEHNETRDKFAEVRRNIRPHKIVSADVKDKDITVRLHPEIGEIIVVNTEGGKLSDVFAEAVQLRIDPAVYDTSPIQRDMEAVTGAQDAARSIVSQPKTATEADISNQSLISRTDEFQDQIEDWLTEIAQYCSEICLLAMTPQQVEEIMGSPKPVDPMAVQAFIDGAGPMPEEPKQTYEWPADRSAEAVFSQVVMKIRSGSTAAPNKRLMQETWTRALPLLQQMILQIRQIDMMGGDSTPERELVKETAARFDETLDVDRFLPPKPPAPVAPALPPQIPGVQPGAPMPGGQPGMPTLQ